MCRLFGLTAGARPVSATFWLLDAPDSLEVQGRRNPDGTGLGFFTADDRPVVDKQPEAAYSDVEFIREARSVRSTTFVAHVRIATTGARSADNTHPFVIDGRIMAHNGGFEDLDVLEAELGDDMAAVRGNTDSERLLALISKRSRACGGDVGAGIADAVRWAAEHLPLYSLNLVLATPGELWALRYPDHLRLYALQRAAAGPPLRGAGSALRVAAGELADQPCVVVASEPMDDDPGWRLMESGELLHVRPDLAVSSEIVVSGPPRQRSVDPLDPPT
jgi:predicted glutamine amidotransferase